MRKYSIIFFLGILLISNVSIGQCSNFAGQYPAATQSTTSNSLVTVTTCGWGGDFSVYDVTAGETYTWTTCGDASFDTQLTLWNTAHTISYGYNDDDCGLQSTITWTATFTGQVHLLLSQYNCANNTTCMTIQWACLTCGGGGGGGADYLHPTAGIANEYVGSCLVADCNATYADDGDLSGNYSNNVNSIYRVFCPDSPLNCITVTFNSFQLEGQYDPPGPPPLDCYWDYLTVGNGPTQNSTLFTTAPATASGRICGSPATPFSFTSTHASGCLTFRFTSDGVTNMSGWDATITCTPCGGGPSGTDNSDCDFATGICSNTGNAGNSTGPGIVAEGCNGAACPAGGENHTNWYSFTIQTSGTLEFDIVPAFGTDDYDFAIYGPGVTCGTLGAPVRCSDAGTTGNTGIAAGNFDTSEDVLGNGYVAPLNVTAGETYYMVVDEWTPTGAGYSLNFTGSASLDCTVLPIELLNFSATYVPSEEGVDIVWTTKTQMANDFFTVQKSKDGSNWEDFRVIKGAGNSTEEITYMVFDANPYFGTSYYRVKQTDFDGKERNSGAVSVLVDNGSNNFTVAPNPTNDKFTVTYNCDSPVPAHLSVYDYSGKIVLENEIDCTSGENSSIVDLSEFPEGIYMVVLTVNGKTLKTKVAKQL